MPEAPLPGAPEDQFLLPPLPGDGMEMFEPVPFLEDMAPGQGPADAADVTGAHGAVPGLGTMQAADALLDLDVFEQAPPAQVRLRHSIEGYTCVRQACWCRFEQLHVPHVSGFV